MNRLLIALLLSEWGMALSANNIHVGAVTLAVRDTDAHTMGIRFSIGWDNSWRTDSGPLNWDAAWVFVKYRVGEGDWHHASLSSPTTPPENCTLQVPSDGRGAFLYRTETGSGTVAYNDLEIPWNYGDDLVAYTDEVTVQVFAIEMVYVPEGPFSLGSGGKQEYEFYKSVFLSSTRNPYLVVDESAISKGTGGALSDPALLDLLVRIPSAFPKGYQSFYCMKYETSQRQYVSFYNTLDSAQQLKLDSTNLDLKLLGSSSPRNALEWEEEGRMVTSAPDLPVSSLSRQQILAYLDWSGLRPMTEMEFEKACRGTAAPVKNEYAWGTTSVASTPYAVADAYTTAERVTNMDGSVATRGNGLHDGNDSMDGPLRSGIFAASVADCTRAWSGGSYYGIMELSGNLSETVITATNAAGRTFVAIHGDGELAEDGGIGGIWPTSMTAYGTRGGSYDKPNLNMQVSYRPIIEEITLLSESIGFRGVRSSITE